MSQNASFMGSELAWACRQKRSTAASINPDFYANASGRILRKRAFKRQSQNSLNWSTAAGGHRRPTGRCNRSPTRMSMSGYADTFHSQSAATPRWDAQASGQTSLSALIPQLPQAAVRSPPPKSVPECRGGDEPEFRNEIVVMRPPMTRRCRTTSTSRSMLPRRSTTIASSSSRVTRSKGSVTQSPPISCGAARVPRIAVGRIHLHSASASASVSEDVVLEANPILLICGLISPSAPIGGGCCGSCGS